MRKWDFLTVQYLEARPELADLAPEEVRARLADAAERLPLTHVLVGWDLPPALLEVCRQEARRLGIKFYRWHPLLTGDGVFVPQPEWQVIGVTGEKIAGFKGMPEFTFVCPNHPEGRAAMLAHLEDILSGERNTGDQYDGLFLDRIRFPSPADHPLEHLGCFCVYCQAEAARQGLDLEEVRRCLLRLAETPAGCLELAGNFFRPQDALLEEFFRFRQNSVGGLLAEVTRRTYAAGWEVGLDCFAPALARMVGQDLAELGRDVDWVKIMVYTHTMGPAGMPFEFSGLASWLVHKAGLDERQAMAYLAQCSGLPLPSGLTELREPGLDAMALMAEVRRGAGSTSAPVIAGIELVDIPGVTCLDPAQVRTDLRAIGQAGAAGLALSWDLWWMPENYLDLVGENAVTDL